jgi:hypothetical protein
VAMPLGFLDAILVSFVWLVVCCVILWLGHLCNSKKKQLIISLTKTTWSVYVRKKGGVDGEMDVQTWDEELVRLWGRKRGD